MIRRERPADVDAIAAVTGAAHQRTGDGQPVEVDLVAQLRASSAWIPALSLVAEHGNGGTAGGGGGDGTVVGHVVCTRAHVDARPALGLGPLSVRPDHQRRGVGKALMHTVLGAADALEEPLVVLLGDGLYYQRFGFVPADSLGITPPVPEWAPHFHARRLHAYTPDLRGTFVYAEPFSRL